MVKSLGCNSLSQWRCTLVVSVVQQSTAGDNVGTNESFVPQEIPTSSWTKHLRAMELACSDNHHRCVHMTVHRISATS